MQAAAVVKARRRGLECAPMHYVWLHTTRTPCGAPRLPLDGGVPAA